jgi:hypothetical protein
LGCLELLRRTKEVLFYYENPFWNSFHYFRRSIFLLYPPLTGCPEKFEKKYGFQTVFANTKEEISRGLLKFEKRQERNSQQQAKNCCFVFSTDRKDFDSAYYAENPDFMKRPLDNNSLVRLSL